MNREIKFRAICRESNRKDLISWDDMKSQGLNQFFVGSIYQLMQYTVFKDKNGKEIYEGDIIRDSSGCGQVGYSPPGFLVDTGDPLRFWLGGGKEYPPNYSLKETEVIGNIYENPELLNRTDKK